jgi:hypothetical protein
MRPGLKMTDKLSAKTLSVFEVQEIRCAQNQLI